MHRSWPKPWTTGHTLKGSKAKFLRMMRTDIDLLIGCNCPKVITSTEVIRVKGEEPYAVRTLLGWSIMGPVATSDNPRDGHALDSTRHRTLTREVISGASDSANQLSFILHRKTKEVINPSAINQMFELNFLEHKNKSKHGLSKEDRKFIQIAEKGIQHRDDGHYELPLPLKNETIELPNNKTVALRRLNQLKRRFMGRNGQKYYTDYLEFMKKLIKNGYAERVPNFRSTRIHCSTLVGWKVNFSRFVLSWSRLGWSNTRRHQS